MAMHAKFNFRYQHYAGQEGKLIPRLQEAQAREGYLTREALHAISRDTGIPLTQIYGVATFYAQFRFTPVGKHLVKVCHGTACHVQGAPDISAAIKEEVGAGHGETTADRLFTIEMVSCLGCCSLAPCIMVGDRTHGSLTPGSVKKVMKTYCDGDRQ
jgi:NADH-quinone oxidoreductase subunit E